MIQSFYGSRSQSGNNGNFDLQRDDNAIKVAIEFCHEIDSFDFLFNQIFAEFQNEGFEDKFVENLEPFILSGYFKEIIIPNVVLKKICDYYFENRKYHILEKIASCLDFTQYEYLDELTVVCSLKSLTTTLIHLTITSNQAEDRSCWTILRKVYDSFKSINKQISLEEIKEWYKKSKDEKYSITSSYQYIGLKFMHIISLFLRGERYPEGKLTLDQHEIYLTQTIEFIFENQHTFDLLNVDERSFFIMMSELYTNKTV